MVNHITIMKRVSYNLTKIAKKMYKGRDTSHGIHHVKRVRDNAMMICKKKNIMDTNILLKIEAAALFHDLWDHKYVVPLSYNYKSIKEQFYSKLKNQYFSDHDIKDIEIIIDNISFSREIQIRNENKYLDLKHLQLMRDIVSDADKLEMLGKSGIERIIEHEIYKYPNKKSHDLKMTVKDIFNNKIKKLIEENYIKTDIGIELAKPLMQEMKNYISILK